MKTLIGLSLFLTLSILCSAQADKPATKPAGSTAAPAAQKPSATPTKPADDKAHPRVQKVEEMMDSFQIMEKAFWQAWKDRDIKPFEQHMAPNAMMIDNTGITDRATALKGLDACDVKGYDLGDFKLTKVDNDVALLTYTATHVEANCGGQKAPATIYASTLYSKSSGKWWMAMHQESAAMPNPPAQ